MTTPATNPHLTPSTYADIKPGDRIVNGYLNPTHPNAHHLARPVHEIVEIRRHTGWVRNWTLPRAERHTRGAHNITHYDYETVIWRDIDGRLFEDRANETVHIVSAA